MGNNNKSRDVVGWLRGLRELCGFVVKSRTMVAW